MSQVDDSLPIQMGRDELESKAKKAIDRYHQKHSENLGRLDQIRDADSPKVDSVDQMVRDLNADIADLLGTEPKDGDRMADKVMYDKSPNGFRDVLGEFYDLREDQEVRPRLAFGTSMLGAGLALGNPIICGIGLSVANSVRKTFKKDLGGYLGDYATGKLGPEYWRDQDGNSKITLSSVELPSSVAYISLSEPLTAHYQIEEDSPTLKDESLEKGFKLAVSARMADFGVEDGYVPPETRERHQAGVLAAGAAAWESQHRIGDVYLENLGLYEEEIETNGNWLSELDESEINTFRRGASIYAMAETKGDRVYQQVFEGDFQGID